jgi:ATP-dependent Clp protease ATP-binding subunit ClpA
VFEIFTELAINTVYDSQNCALKSGCSEVYVEHLLYAIVRNAKGISLRLFKNCGLDAHRVEEEIKNYVSPTSKNNVVIPFNQDYKALLKLTLDIATKSGNKNVLFEHLFLALLNYKNSNVHNILEEHGFDIFKARDILNKLVQKKVKKLSHPEGEESSEVRRVDEIYKNFEHSSIFNKAVSKLSASGYEILGTEQILSAILETDETDISKLLAQYGITHDSFENSLKKLKSRDAEYSGRKVVFTPNAFLVMNKALQVAKELGSSTVLPEHIILGILDAKKGIASEILKDLDVDFEDLMEKIIKPIEKQMPETLIILKLAKEEARRIGRNVVGTEMFLLGIIGEGSGVGAKVLNNLEITLKDARAVVEKQLGYGNEYFDNEIAFTKRAKNVLEKAWKLAQEAKRERINSEDLLLAITSEQNSLAMKVLGQLGVDAVEIKYGILKEIEKS